NVLLKIDDEIQFRNVDIVDEDEFTFSIHCKDIFLPFIRKDQLYTYISCYVFGFDKEEMIKTWNKEINKQIHHKEVELNSLKSYLILDNFTDKYKLYKKQ
ncbi:MAG: hypothetical protein IJH34_00045, partial [Romboutsia sp.]|nr:hypothetical protein [Romboutsia sp.]